MAAQNEERRRPVYRLAVFGRVVLAVVGSYAVAALTTGLLALTLPFDRSEAVAAATLLSFAVMVAVVILVFAAPTLVRAAVAVGGLALVLGGALWLIGGFAGTPAAA